MGKILASARIWSFRWFIESTDNVSLPLNLSLQRHNVPMYRIIGVRDKGNYGSRKFLIEMKKSGNRVEKGLLLDVHEVSILVATRNPIAKFINYVLNASEPWVSSVLDWLHWLSWCSRLGWNGLLIIVFPVDKSMA